MLLLLLLKVLQGLLELGGIGTHRVTHVLLDCLGLGLGHGHAAQLFELR